ncbi:hypothetical protein [Kitasatospora sp. A2-31]|uniref:hypothetical protein n=1 Tax=Kitasatospora sp. A2-31 TaxID=2916414 RepID=UPI001EEBA5F8|nr:hypothetical protein [Kitasatospora sp. A2-31]MCG6494105.1 hypothetical protein [Kitasatospora sp. A2-31]
MAGIVVLFELDRTWDDQGADEPVMLVHAAGQDPDLPEDPQARTLCGLDTAAMAHSHHQPSAPGEPWYPPELADRRCPVCEAALKRA